jgi:hypothetical protein
MNWDSEEFWQALRALTPEEAKEMLDTEVEVDGKTMTMETLLMRGVIRAARCPALSKADRDHAWRVAQDYVRRTNPRTVTLHQFEVSK